MDKIGFAILALIVLLALAFCGGPLTKKGGVKAGDEIHLVLTKYIAGTDPIAELDGLIRPKVIDLVTSNNGEEGVTIFIESACDRIILLMRNRIRSSSDNREKARLRKAIPIIRAICKDAKSQAEEPPD